MRTVSPCPVCGKERPVIFEEPEECACDDDWSVAEFRRRLSLAEKTASFLKPQVSSEMLNP